MTKRWSVYMLHCDGGLLYCGVSDNVDASVRRHSQGRGSHYVSRHRPAELVYAEECGDHEAALRRRADIRRLTRRGKLDLIGNGSRERPVPDHMEARETSTVCSKCGSRMEPSGHGLRCVLCGVARGRGGRRWMEGEILEMRRLLATGLTVDQVGAALGRSASSIAQRRMLEVGPVRRGKRVGAG